MSSAPVLLITAGPSREYLDDVRYLTNASSGRTGVAVAAAARARGWRVHLALGPGAAVPPADVEVHRFVSTLDLDRIARELWPEVQALVATAAPADYRPAARVAGKRKKQPGSWHLELVRTPDVLAGRAAEKGDRLLVGFALEASLDRAEARRKLVEKQLDLIILNTTPNLGSESGAYEWLEATGVAESFQQLNKHELAERIVRYLDGRLGR